MKFFSREPTVVDSLAIKVSLRNRIRDTWKGLNLLWKFMIVIGLLAVLGIPFYGRAIKATNTRSYAQDLTAAKRALADGRNVDARDLSFALLRRDPKNHEPMPLLMQATAGARDPLLVAVARGYLAMNTQNKSERVFAWKAIAKDCPVGSAGITWFSDIRENERADPDFLFPWLERLKAERLGNEIEAVLVKQTGVIDPRMERFRLSMLAIRGTEVSYRELQARLFDRIASHPADGPLLIDSIDEVPQSALIPYSFIALGEWLKTSGGEPSVENQLRLARCEMAAKPEAAEAILIRTADAHATAPFPMAGLYMTLNRYDRAEELLQPLVAKGDPKVFSLMAKVLENQHKLDEWDRLLASPPEGVFLPGILCDRAYIAMQKGDERAKVAFEQEASIHAEKQMDSDSLIQLARHATDRGMNDYAQGIWVKAIRRGPSTPLPLFTSISSVFETLARDKQDSQLLEILSVYRVADPGNLDVVTQHLYLACLIGSVTPSQLLSVLSPLNEKFNTRQLNLTVAFAQLLEGRTDLADKLTSDTTIDWFAEIPAFRAIRAATLVKTGRQEEAEIYMEDFPWEGLLPCEKRVFRELLKPKESGQAEDRKIAEKTEKTEKAMLTEKARQEQRNEELNEVRETLAALAAKEAAETVNLEEPTDDPGTIESDAVGKNKESEKAALKAEKSRLAEETRQAQRTEELNKVRGLLAARAAKKAAETANLEKPKDDPESTESDAVQIIKESEKAKLKDEAKQDD